MLIIYWLSHCFQSIDHLLYCRNWCYFKLLYVKFLQILRIKTWRPLRFLEKNFQLFIGFLKLNFNNYWNLQLLLWILKSFLGILRGKELCFECCIGLRRLFRYRWCFRGLGDGLFINFGILICRFPLLVYWRGFYLFISFLALYTYNYSKLGPLLEILLNYDKNELILW